MSLRRYLLLGILIPVCLLVVINTFSLYNQTFRETLHKYASCVLDVSPS